MTLDELAERCRILATCVVAAVVYGVLHDLVTAHVCVEYFSRFHPPVIASESPVALALVWGVLATWWVGAGLAVPLVAAARLGAAPRWTARQLRPLLGALLLSCAAAAALAGVAGGGWARATAWQPLAAWRSWLPRGAEARFFGVLVAHNISYLMGFSGGLAVAGAVLVSRARARRAAAAAP
ncbi:MAG: hypothetical protein IT204_22350 [Fimbriimonadaceae bacterium]|nr:hypothetical protein [Fimbriimonadaceae bacterium]